MTNNASPSVLKSFNNQFWLKRLSVVLVVLLLLLWLFRNLLLGTQVDTYAVTMSDLTQTVVASGRVITPQRIAISSQLLARVQSVAVAEGSTVKQGQLLIQLNDDDARAGVAQASAALEQASARLRTIQEVELPAAEHTLGETEANLVQARNQLKRIQDLKENGFVGQSELDNAQRNFDVARSQVDSAKLQIVSRQPSGSNYVVAEMARTQAQAALEQASVKLEQTRVLAPVNGTLISREVEAGDVIQPGQVLMFLAGEGKIQIEVQLDEKNLSRINVGQSALASADAFASERFDAVVSYINPGIDATRGAVEVKLDVPAPPDYLRQDMTVSVDIHTAQRKGVLVVPTGTIHDIASAEPWVLVVRQRRAVRQPVKVGLRGDENVEVLEGLVSGEPVISASIKTVLEGARVRARQVVLQ